MFVDVFLLFLYLNDIFIIYTILEFHFLSLRILRYCSSGIEYCEDLGGKLNFSSHVSD